ncbi:MAG: diguanylate cyclase [Candidatus Eremiobacteraeota bacterium]|nr:diguanylate cyclase [Candidatus Eremiobacteraeota bacterium]
MGTDRLTSMLDDEYLEDPLDIELARAERYGRQIGFILLEPDFGDLTSTMVYQALKYLAAVCREHTRKVDIKVRWGNSILIVLPETAAEGLEVAVRKLTDAFARQTFDHPTNGQKVAGHLAVAKAVFPGFEKSAEVSEQLGLRRGLLHCLRLQLSQERTGTEVGESTPPSA